MKFILTGLAVLLSLVLVCWYVRADYFPAIPTPVYPAVTELGTIADSGTATCGFAQTPVCHFTIASGSSGLTVANPSSNPPTVGETVTVAWTQAAGGYPSITWANKWYGYDYTSDTQAALSTNSAFYAFLTYSNAGSTGAAALTFMWDGTHYVLNFPVSLTMAKVIAAGSVFIKAQGGPGGGLYLPNQLIGSAAPTISSGFGTGASIGTSNGTGAFTVNVGTSSASTGVIGLPNSVSTDWSCFCTDISTNSTSVFITKQTARSSSSCTVGNFSDVAAATAWADNDILSCTAVAY